METKIPRSTPAQEGVDAQHILDFLDEIAAKKLELHSLMIVKNGKVITEGWWHPYSAEQYHGCYSVTKAFVCMAVGFAEEEELLFIDDFLSDFFPEKLPENPSVNLLSMRLKDLLCMACGIPQEVDLVGVEDSVKAFMADEVTDQPGTVFRYNSICTHMLLKVVEKVSGMDIIEYLTPRLFVPLGIEQIRWDKNPLGEYMGGWGIHITTETLAKMGQMLLQKGKWGEKQVVPQSWVELISGYKIDNGDPNSTEPSDFGCGYCYQLWNCLEEGSFRLDGAFGQVSMVFPQYQLVIAITEGAGNAQHTFDTVRKHLLNTAEETGCNPEADALLAERLQSLSLNEAKIGVPSSLVPAVSGTVYRFSPNELSLIPDTQRKMSFETNCGIHSLSLTFGEEEAEFCWKEGNRENRVNLGLDGNYRYAVTQMPYHINRIAGCGNWEDENTFRMVLREVEEPHGMEIKLCFDGDAVTLSYQPTITRTPWISLTGIKEN